MASTPTDPEVVPGSAILIIDPQVDFHPGGALPVAGADEDANRIGSFIRNNLDGLEAVHITLDSHQRNHISHSLFWVNAEGKAPPPFTPISHKDVVMKKWVAALPENQDYVEQYTRTLEENGRFQHCIWPEHCLIGSPGHCVVPPILEACHAWVEHSRRPLTFTHKGMNVLTEMYSCFKADVPIASDPSTGMNVKLVESLLRHPKVYICGQALSHCVAFSVRDLVSAWPPERLEDLVLLCHMSSPVGGFEAQAQAFVQFAKDQGLTVIGA